MKLRRALTAAALLALPPYHALAQAAGAEEKPKPTPAPTEHVAKAAPFEIAVELDALFVADKEHRISLAPKAWADMSLLSVVPHGTRVKKGDKLVEIDTEKLARQIGELEAGEPAARLALKIAEAELASLEKATPVQLEAARRTRRIADEDLAHYERVGHREALRAAERSIEFAQQSYDYAKEELEQLQKMYEADDLTEETEEIILKRARNSFERATEQLRLSKMRAEREIKVIIPRHRVANKAETESATLVYDDAVGGLPRALQQKRFAVEKAKRDREVAVRKLRDLRADLASFDVRSPADGIVYYGMSRNGKWITAAALAKKLVPGGKLSPREVFVTVVETGGLSLAAGVPEEKLAHLKPGLAGTATPVSDPTLKIPAKVTKVGRVPGAFSARLNADTGDSLLFPGMKAKVKLDVAKFDKAITIPNNLLDNGAVWVEEDGEATRREVRVGPSDGKVTVIRSGLKEGEKVVGK